MDLKLKSIDEPEFVTTLIRKTTAKKQLSSHGGKIVHICTFLSIMT